MAWLLAAVVIIVIGLAVMAGAGKFGQVPAVVDDRPVPDLPEGDLDAESLRSARFAVVPRGYSVSGGSAPRASGCPDGGRPGAQSHEDRPAHP